MSNFKQKITQREVQDKAGRKWIVFTKTETKRLSMELIDKFKAKEAEEMISKGKQQAAKILLEIKEWKPTYPDELRGLTAEDYAYEQAMWAIVWSKKLSRINPLKRKSIDNNRGKTGHKPG
jgi:hypothetical protein